MQETIKVLIERCCKWICLVLIIVIIGYWLYDWRDSRYETAYNHSRNLAVSLSQVGGMLNSNPLRTEINRILTINGFPELQIKLLPTAPDSTKGAGK